MIPTSPLKPRFFKTSRDFRKWLGKHGGTKTEIVLGIHKKGHAPAGITYSEALDEALCHGWIDGVRRSLDAASYSIRFTPRKPRSIWSLVNIRHVERLKKEGRMTPAGLAAFSARETKRTGIYSFEQKKEPAFSPMLGKRFRADRAAWRCFSSQPPGYRRTATFWVMSAKREETRLRRADRLIADSAAGRRLPILTSKK